MALRKLGGGRQARKKEELDGLIENYIRDEVFYRAGRAAGLDRDDAVVREARAAEDGISCRERKSSVPEPTEAQLIDFLQSRIQSASEQMSVVTIPPSFS